VAELQLLVRIDRSSASRQQIDIFSDASLVVLS
jgi:hypothetical protein